MGTFGLGGLHRKTTWLNPVATFAALPPRAADGAACITKDTNLAWEYDAAVPGWIPLAGGGGSVPTATSAPGGGTQGKWTADENKGLKIVAGVGEVKVDGTTMTFSPTGALVATGTLNADKIVVAKYTHVFNTHGIEVPLVVIDNAGNVVVAL